MATDSNGSRECLPLMDLLVDIWDVDGRSRIEREVDQVCFWLLLQCTPSDQ